MEEINGIPKSYFTIMPKMKKIAPTLYLYNNIFYPQTIIPLTVSDETSKKMLTACFENNMPLALFYPHERSKGIGTLGKVILIEKNADKSLSVAVLGLSRVKLRSMDIQEPFPYFEYEEYNDTAEMSQVLFDSPIERLHLVLEHWLARHIHSIQEREKFLKDINSPAKLVNNLCMLIIKDVELKLIFLESTSLLDRVRMMNALLVGDEPETEDFNMCEAIKNFERLDITDSKNAS